jgi:hypothetical protein
LTGKTILRDYIKAATAQSHHLHAFLARPRGKLTPWYRSRKSAPSRACHGKALIVALWQQDRAKASLAGGFSDFSSLFPGIFKRLKRESGVTDGAALWASCSLASGASRSV